MNNKENPFGLTTDKDGNFYDTDGVLLKTCPVITHIIGVCEADENHSSYCLGRTINMKFEILLIKTLDDKKAFSKEVNNLSKYFNARIIKEKQI